MARRFVTYNTEDQKAGRVNVDHNGVMKPGGGAGLPSDVGAYKYMATDGEGNWVAEDRLAWKGQNKTTLFGEKEIAFNGGDWLYTHVQADTDKLPMGGELVLVAFDDKVYECVAEANEHGSADFGGRHLDDGPEFSEYPFACMVDWRGEIAITLPAQQQLTHTIGIEIVETTTHTISPEYLPTTFVPTAVIKSSDYDNALAGVAAAKEEAVTYECTNMTFEEAYQLLASGKPLQTVALVNAGGPSCINAMVAFAGPLMGVPCLVVVCGIVGEEATPAHVFTAYWTADGLSTEAPI